MAISYSKLFVGISLPALCTGLASLLLSISANAQTIRPTTQKELKVFDPTTGNSGNIGIRAAAGTLSYTLTLPATAPSVNQVLSASAVTGGNVSLTWATPVSGTVTSVGLSVPTGFSVSGSPVTSAGTLSLSYAIGYALPTTSSQANWGEAYNDRITAASVTGTTTKTITLTQQDGGTVTATFSDLNTDLVSSVFGRTGAVTPTAGDYTTAQVTEIGNLYYTDARAREAISLATTGSSGAATYSSTTGILNIPNYTLTGLGGVGGSGTVNYLSKFAAAGTLTNSLIFDNGTNVGVGTASPSSTTRLEIRGAGTTSATTALEVDNSLGNPLLVVKNDGNVGIGTTTPRGKLDVMDGDLLLTDKDVSQPATSYADANAFGRLNPLSGVNGGLDIWGFSDANATAMRLIGIMGNSNPTDATPAILFRGDKLNSTESQALSATETVFQFSNFTSPLVTILGSGNVGIGTTSPGHSLEIFKNSFPGLRITSTSNFPYIQLNNGGNDADSKLLELAARFNGLNFASYQDNGNTKTQSIMLLNSNGNVGIGTTSPSFKLVVEGAQETGVPSLSGNKFATLGLIATNSEPGAGGSIEFGVKTNTTAAAIKLLGENANNNTRGDLAFYTRAATTDASMTERMRITYTGNVGIGTTNPGDDKLQINESTNADIQASLIARGGNNRRAQFNFGVSASSSSTIGGAVGSDGARGGGLVLNGNTSSIASTAHVLINNSGAVTMSSLIGTGIRYVTVDASGTLTATLTASSDIRLKSNIEVIPNALLKVMSLRGVTYNWKDGRDTTRVLGMIAQEVMKVAPELVFKNADGYYAIHYGETTGLLVEAIKEQQKIIDQLKTEQAATGALIRQLQLDLQAIRKLNTAPKE